jgi:cytochrome c oxidase cbb3-type subunit I
MTSSLPTFSKATEAATILLVGSISWALVGAGLQVLSTLQLLIPSLAYILPIPWISYGKLTPLATFLFTYGWITSGFLGVLTILIPRISGIPFRYGRVLAGAAILWHVAVLVGLAEILWNGSTGLISMPFSRSVTALFFLSFIILGTGLTRGLGRSWKTGPLLPRLYLLGALLAFPLGLGTAELLLRGGLAPGALQIMMQFVWNSFLHHLWLTPLALVLLFQLLPVLTGRPVGSLSLGLLCWVATITLGGWIGDSLASEGPVPSWLQSAGVVSTLLLGIAVWGNGTLLKALLEGKWEECRRQVALRFLAVGLWSYLASYAWLAFLALPAVRPTTTFTMVAQATQTLLLFSFYGNVLAGAIYALLPASRAMGWPSHPALTIHFWFSTIGLGLIASSYSLAGIFQGLALNDPGVPMSTISSYLRPFLCTVLVGQVLWWIGQLSFSTLFFASLLKLFPSVAPAAIFPADYEDPSPLLTEGKY